jgi:hypothetical protein
MKGYSGSGYYNYKGEWVGIHYGVGENEKTIETELNIGRMGEE